MQIANLLTETSISLDPYCFQNYFSSLKQVLNYHLNFPELLCIGVV